MDKAFACIDDLEMERACRMILNQHHSTRAWLAYLQPFFQSARAVCGLVDRLLNLACGLNPFAQRFMNQPADVRYHACEIHTLRIDLINHFFRLMGVELLAEARDVLVCPPRYHADAALLLKDAHHMEQRRADIRIELMQMLNTRVVFAGLLNRSLDGRRDLRAHTRALNEKIAGGGWSLVGVREFSGESLL